MKNAIVIVIALVAVSLGACRREAEQRPLKLGGPVAAEHVAR